MCDRIKATFRFGFSGADFTELSMDRISSMSMWIFPSPSKVCPRKRNVSVAHREGISELIPVFQSLMLNVAAGLMKVLRL
ncbi:hypothetical protein T07_7946 [Trichinella nelsoni]|uniref:Uncharacterized protein n=1 Tax=Trichinella nelsoni TaxID=6336 RepID=A0A0V0RUX2_9BILA|nr:hypothetical protein T07_7946 [Trichinella nelsoni]